MLTLVATTKARAKNLLIPDRGGNAAADRGLEGRQQAARRNRKRDAPPDQADQSAITANRVASDLPVRR